MRFPHPLQSLGQHSRLDIRASIRHDSGRRSIPDSSRLGPLRGQCVPKRLVFCVVYDDDALRLFQQE